MTSRAYHGTRHAPPEQDRDLYPGIPTPTEILQWIESGGGGHPGAQGYPKPGALRRAYRDLTDPPRTQHRWVPDKESMFCPICQQEQHVSRKIRKQFEAHWVDQEPITDYSWRHHPGPRRCTQVHLLKPREYSEPRGIWPFRRRKKLPKETWCGDERPLQRYWHRGSWLYYNSYRQKAQKHIYKMPWQGYPIITVNCSDCLTLSGQTEFIDWERMTGAEIAKAKEAAAKRQQNQQYRYLPKGEPRRTGPGPEQYLDHA